VSETADEKRMKLRYAGACRLCGAELAARTEAIYERSMKTVRCLGCSPAELAPLVELVETPEPIDIGTPGSSARREYERRQAKRGARIRGSHPKLGGVILAVTDDPQSTTPWDTGALGEERLGRRLNELSSDTLRVLHDRRIPGSRANIDHLAVTPWDLRLRTRFRHFLAFLGAAWTTVGFVVALSGASMAQTLLVVFVPAAAAYDLGRERWRIQGTVVAERTRLARLVEEALAVGVPGSLTPTTRADLRLLARQVQDGIFRTRSDFGRVPRLIYLLNREKDEKQIGEVAEGHRARLT
jgi:hypothetical protein